MQWFQQQREARAGRRQGRPPNNYWVISIGTVAMIAVALALLASLVNLWPSVEVTATTASTTTATTTAAANSAAHTTHTVRLFFALLTVHVTPGTALLLLVIILGALGSLIQVTTSFGDFIGNRRFYSSWAVWYLLRLIVGVLLALIFYFAVRGGFFSGSSPSSSVNPYGIAALAGLAGLFSKQATDKLREVFETLFRVSSSAGDAQRRDDLANPSSSPSPSSSSNPSPSPSSNPNPNPTPNPKPTVTALEPSEVTVGATQVRVKIHGEHFIDKVSLVKLGDVNHQLEFVSAQQLELMLPDATFVEAGALQIVVYNHPPGGGESEPPSILAIIAPPIHGVAAASV
jgi:hypothetical protein